MPSDSDPKKKCRVGTMKFSYLVCEPVTELPELVARMKRVAELGYDGIELTDRKSTRLNSSHIQKSRMPSSA